MTKRRQEIRRQALAARKRRQRARTASLIAAAVTVFGTLLVWGNLQSAPGETVVDLGNRHLTEGETFGNYNSRPPTSGPHYTSKAQDGVHTEPIADELQVHNLEDGAVIIQYDCPDGCSALIAQLEDILSRYPSELLLAPYPEMGSRIALTAWGRIDRLEDFDEERIISFIDAYRGIDHHR